MFGLRHQEKGEPRNQDSQHPLSALHERETKTQCHWKRGFLHPHVTIMYPLSLFHGSDWPHSLQPLYITKPHHHPWLVTITISASIWNIVFQTWGWRQHIWPKRQCQTIQLHSVKTQRTIIWTVSTTKARVCTEAFILHKIPHLLLFNN